MLKLRLQRIGRRNEPSYRIVATDVRNGPKSNNFIEIIGSYQPKAGTKTINKDRALHWISMGAQTSETVHNMFVKEGVIEGKTVNNLPKKEVTGPRKKK